MLARTPRRCLCAGPSLYAAQTPRQPATRRLLTTQASDASSSTSSARPWTNPTLNSLSTRGLIHSASSRLLDDHLSSPSTAQRSIYLGIDPTAPSLHVGHLIPLLALVHLVHHGGHKGVLLVGGATASIGDPTGKNAARPDLDGEALQRNVRAIERQLEQLVMRIGEHLGARRRGSADEQEVGKEATPTPMLQAAGTGVGAAAEQAAEAAMNSVAGDAATTPPVPGAASDTQANTSGESSASLLARSGLDIKIMNNRDFYEGMSLLDFLKTTGKFARLGEMLARDSVKTRLPPPLGTAASQASGMSFTELTYQLLQAYDFWCLHSRADAGNCTVQLGGSDQMGNIMAGVELIRRKAALDAGEEGQQQQESKAEAAPTRHAFALTTPLLTTSTGEKLGKSAGNAVFLSPEHVSDYGLYQYLLRTPDADVAGLLQRLTFLDETEVHRMLAEDSMEEMEDSEAAKQGILRRPLRRLQDVLAEQVTLMVRGKEALQAAKKTTFLFHRLLPSFTTGPALTAYARTYRPRLWDELHALTTSEPSTLPPNTHRIRHLPSSAIGTDYLTLFSETTNLCESRGAVRSILAKKHGGSAGPLFINGAAMQPVDPRQVAKAKLKEKEVVWLPREGGKGEGAMVWLRKGKRDARVLLWDGEP